MMKKYEPAHIIHYYFKRLKKYIRQVEKNFNEETIHLFRVEVKKIRAFLRMLRLDATRPGELKFPHKFKKMYSLTGKIRDRQLYLKYLKENKLQHEITAAENEIEDLKKKKDEFLSKKELEEIEERFIENAPEKIDNELIKKFFLQKLDAIREIIAEQNYKDDRLHNIRKCLKDLIYIIRVFRNDLKIPSLFLFWNKTELKNAEDLAHTLGLFNDACVALSFVKISDIKKENKDKQEKLLIIRRKWLSEKRRLKKEVLVKLHVIKLN